MPHHVARLVRPLPQHRALVTDTGGVLRHPAIIAREYGIAAVVATGNATTLQSDGQIVTSMAQPGRSS